MVGVKPAIAQLVEHLTVELAEIRWSLVRFRVAGFAWRHTWIKSWQMFCSVVSTSTSLLWDLSPRPPAYWAGALPTNLKRQWHLPASILTPAEDPFRVLLGQVLGLKGWNSRSRSTLFGHRALAILAQGARGLGSSPRTALCDAALKQNGRCMKADHARP